MSNIYYQYDHDKDNILKVELGINSLCPLHFHRSIEILYVLEGAMETQVGNEKYLAKPDDIIFVHNYYHHSFTPMPEYRKLFLVIPYNYANEFEETLKNYTLFPLLSDKEFNRENILPIYKKLYNEAKTLPSAVKRGYLYVILGHLFSRYPKMPFTRTSNIDFLIKVLTYIDENYQNNIDLNTLAQSFGYNKCYFSFLFNKYIGEKINNYINLVRLQHFIKEIKKDETRSITKVAFNCGFNSLTTFYRCFCNFYGKKPQEYLEL